MDDDLTAALLRMLRGSGRPPGRVLLTGWFSFLDGEATAGDTLAQRQASAALTRAGIPHDTAWSPGFRPGALSLEAARPEAYGTVLFVCGPVHGPQVARLHARFRTCRRLAAGVSVVDPADPGATGFHEIVARDGTAAPARHDLAAAAPAGPLPPVAGVLLSQGQGEYGAAAGTRRSTHGSPAGWPGRTAHAYPPTPGWPRTTGGCAPRPSSSSPWSPASTSSSPPGCTAWCWPCAPAPR
ncbi:hypothetical protein [Streptomyces sp. NPDC053069]|uniref:hypothetical protein n=1 Tax=Streptomyces sp. NPDC053069 TaxID=3365695 RepID=UPI0037D4980A